MHWEDLEGWGGEGGGRGGSGWGTHVNPWLFHSMYDKIHHNIKNKNKKKKKKKMDWLDFLAVQGTLKSLLQHHSSKASIFWHSAFFTVQFSHPYMTTGKIIALTRQMLTRRTFSH